MYWTLLQAILDLFDLDIDAVLEPDTSVILETISFLLMWLAPEKEIMIVNSITT